VVQPTLGAGDVVLFLGGCVAHGGAAWRGQGERRTVIQFLGPRCGKCSLFEPFLHLIIEKRSFYQDRLGTNIGKS
jgi:hypothetical protein